MSSVLELHGVTRRFGGVVALGGVSFAVNAGEIVAMIGPNGAGKTTCVNAIDGTVAPDAGEVHFRGRRVTGLAPEARARLGIARTFQVASTFGSMTVRESVAIALAAHARGDGRFIAAPLALHTAGVDAVLTRAGITVLAEQVCGALAWGEAKRVELALARAGSPRLLLMDEPTAGLEPDARRSLMEDTRAIARAEGVAVLFTEHDMDIVFGYADRVLVLNRGTLIADGTPAEVRADARVAAAYLGGRVERSGPVDTSCPPPSIGP